MSWSSIAEGLRRLFRRAEVDAELDDEVAQFLEASTREHVARGLSRVEAERLGRIEFGGVEAAKENVRGSGWESAIDSLARDVAGGIRALRRNPTFAAVTCVTLALGIGANTAMFTVVNAVLLRPLPYSNPRALALVWTDDTRRGLHEERTAYRTILDWRADNHTLQDIAYWSSRSSLHRRSSRATCRRGEPPRSIPSRR